MGSIYKITNTVNGKAYIGQTIHDAEKTRIPHHFNGHGNMPIQCAIKKYGKDAFTYEILHDGIIIELLDSFEIEAIKKYNTVAPNGYNLTYGGGRPIFSKETLQKRSISLKGKPSHMKGKKHSEATRRKISEANKGRKHKPETRRRISKSNKNRSPEVNQKISEALKGRNFSLAHRQNLSKSFRGRKLGPFSEAHRQKISEANKGKKHTPETCLKMSSPHKQPAQIFFRSLPECMPLAEKSRKLHEKFTGKVHQATIYRWVREWS